MTELSLKKNPNEMKEYPNATGDGKHCIENVNNKLLFRKLVESLSVSPEYT